MASLNLNDLTVESFPTLESPVFYMMPPETWDSDLECCDEEVVYFAPITAHTDPCDVCCQQQ